MYVRHIVVRTVVVALVCIFAFLIPNLNLLLTLVGAILGTIISVIIPVLFYNRAYQYPEGSKHFGKGYQEFNSQKFSEKPDDQNEENEENEGGQNEQDNDMINEEENKDMDGVDKK